MQPRHLLEWRVTSYVFVIRELTRFPHNENRDGLRNIGLLTIQPPDAAVSPRIFYWTLVSSEP